MAHALWTGSVGFGLVNIPVSLYSAETSDDLSFTLLDKRDLAPIGYRKFNKKTGEEVSKQDIVKGFEVSAGEFVTVTDEELKRAAPDKTQRVDIHAFVDADDLDPAYICAPYYLEPAAKADKVYGLLREALKRTKKAGIATVVLRAKQYLAVVLPRGDALMLLLLRYAHELRSPDELRLPAGDAKNLKLGEAELKMAERLIEDLAAPWDPAQYRDEYRETLLEFMKNKAGKGTEKVELPAAPSKAAKPPEDIMALLKKSVVHAGKAKPPVRGRPLRH